MKETKEEIKARIINDLANKNVKGISWLQNKYGIGFKLAEEIYLNYCEEKASNELGLRNRKKAENDSDVSGANLAKDSDLSKIKK